MSSHSRDIGVRDLSLTSAESWRITRPLRAFFDLSLILALDSKPSD